MQTNANNYRYYKVGKSVNPKKRLGNLQMGNPRQLNMNHPGLVNNMKAAERDLIHEVLNAHQATLGGGRDWYKVPIDQRNDFLEAYTTLIGHKRQHAE